MAVKSKLLLSVSTDGFHGAVEVDGREYPHLEFFYSPSRKAWFVRRDIPDDRLPYKYKGNIPTGKEVYRIGEENRKGEPIWAPEYEGERWDL